MVETDDLWTEKSRSLNGKQLSIYTRVAQCKSFFPPQSPHFLSSPHTPSQVSSLYCYSLPKKIKINCVIYFKIFRLAGSVALY